MKQKRNPVELFYSETIEQMEHDEYSKQYFKRLNQSIRTIFGVIDSEVKKHNNDRMRVSFMKSLLHNIFMRSGLYQLPEEQFIEIMRGIYITGHTSKDRVVHPPETH